MGEITIHPQDLDRLLTDGTSSRPRTISYQQAYVDIAATHYGRPVSEILPSSTQPPTPRGSRSPKTT